MIPHKVLYIDPAGQWWGSEQSLLLMLTALDASRVAPVLSVPSGSELEKRAQAAGIQTHRGLPANLHLHSNFLLRIYSIFALMVSVCRFRPSLLHLNQAGAIRYALFVSRLFRLPLVVHVRLIKDVPLIIKRCNRNYSSLYFIANSSCVLKALRNAGVPEEQSSHVINPIDLSDAVEDSSSIALCDSDLFTIGYVGRLSPDKGIEVFLKATARLKPRYANLRVIVIGSSSSSGIGSGPRYEDKLTALCRDLDITSIIIFLGFRSDARQLMKAFDIFVLPSDEEPWGRVLCEALIAGVPVVATGAGGATDIVSDGTTGLLFPPGDVEALVKCVEELYDDPERRSRLAKTGRNWVLKNCDPSRHASSVADIYDRLASTSSS